MGKNKDEIVFKTGQLICPFRGHQQSTRPRQPHNQAWAHNGIREGTPGCLYINASNNQDSPVWWLRIAGHENLANCRIRSIPKPQGGGLGVYAEDEIWHRQELLLANRENPMEGEATARENIHELLEDGTDDEEVLGADDTTGEVALEESRGHQYATCDDTGGWRMHEPMHPWTDGTLIQQSTPPPVSNIPRWTNLTAEYQDTEIPIAKATALRKDL